MSRMSRTMKGESGTAWGIEGILVSSNYNCSMINNLKLETTMIDGPEKLQKLSSSIRVAVRQRENLGITDQVAVTRSI